MRRVIRKNLLENEIILLKLKKNLKTCIKLTENLWYVFEIVLTAVTSNNYWCWEILNKCKI